MSKTIEEIKDEVAIEYGWKSWKSCYGDDGITNTMIDEVAQRYTQSQTQYLIKSLDAKQEQIDKLIKKYDRREIDFKSQTQELQEHNAELVDVIKDLIPMAEDGYRLHKNNGSHQDFLEDDRDILKKAKELLTKHNHLNKKP